MSNIFGEKKSFTLMSNTGRVKKETREMKRKVLIKASCFLSFCMDYYNSF